MNAENEVRLRLRFYKDVAESITTVRQKFEDYKDKCPYDYSIKVNENHIWLHIIGIDKHYYSPHLHLELEEKSENETHIRGLFGPDPTLWTLFMFLHFIVAGVFLIFGLFLYSNITMKQPIFMNGMVMLLMVIVWFGLYFLAKQIREKGNDQMNDLEKLFNQIIN
jgi:hypothetical protein